MKATNLLHWALRTVLYRCIVVLLIVALAAGGRQGDTLHQVKCSVLLQRICMTNEMAHDGGTFVRHRLLF
jgi:hypothetical protein